MRIPLGEEEMGCWYPIGDDYYIFVPDYLEHYSKRYLQFRRSTFREFKEQHPNPVEHSSRFRYRNRKR
jgi:hypothetical protein